ncbi:hypothetical protein VARIO8X_90415 [Burkholderiales bacterium 8X]|nr:hypothetical protein VARIO8X_90415 [Burkholderiales bacterium 8X]
MASARLGGDRRGRCAGRGRDPVGHALSPLEAIG